MKFGKEIQAQRIPVWASHYVDYKGLKKIINSLPLPSSIEPIPSSPLNPSTLTPSSSLITSQPITPPPLSTSQPPPSALSSNPQPLANPFFFKLERELDKINEFYISKQNELQTRLRTLIEKRKVLIRGRGIIDGRKMKQSSGWLALYEGFRNFERDLGRLQQYIELNATAFRKILKKFDKRSKSTTRELYLARQVDVQPAFNRGELSKLSDIATANIVELERLLEEGVEEEQVDGMKVDGMDYEMMIGSGGGANSSAHGSDISISAATATATNLTTLTSTSPIASRRPSPFERNRILLDSDRESLVDSFEDLEATLRQAVRERDEQVVKDTLERLQIGMIGIGGERSGDKWNQFQRILWKAALEETETEEEKKVNGRVTNGIEGAEDGSEDENKKSLIPPELLDFKFIDDINYRTTLHSSALAGRISLVKLCLDPANAVPISSVDAYGRTALHYSTMNGHHQITSLLLDLGADPYLMDFDGFNSVIYSVTQGRTECERVLMEKGVSFEPQNAGDFNPLNLAAQYGHEEITRILLEKNGSKILANAEGLFPQHLASKAGHHHILKLLIDLRGSKEIVDTPDRYQSWTPIFHACFEGYVECVRVLIEAGCDVNAKDEYGKTPIHYAGWESHIDCLNLLIVAGASNPGRIQLGAFTSSENLNSPSQTFSSPSDGPRGFSSISNPTMSTGSEGYDKMELEPDNIPSLALPPPIIPFRIYGHNYLEEKSLLQITLGHPNTTRGNGPQPVTLYGRNNQFSSLKLVITSKPATIAIPHSVILPLADEREVFSSQLNSFEGLSLEFHLFPTFGSKMIGKAVALPSLFFDLINQGKYILPLLDFHLKVIGELAFEVTVVKPFNGVRLDMSGGNVQTYWRSTRPIGNTIGLSNIGRFDPLLGATPPLHPLSGSQSLTPSLPSSFVTASSMSGRHIQIIVQVTSDGIPVCWPDWKLPNIGGVDLDLKVADLTFERFLELAKVMNKEWNDIEESKRADMREWWRRIKGSMIGLKELLKLIPESMGVVLQIKYPTRSDIQRLNIKNVLDVNHFVDSILTTVYGSSKSEDGITNSGRNHRRTVFSSFNPVVCTALNWKQPNYAVFFASHCGLSRSSPPGEMLPANRVEDDRRCTSIREACAFARANNLLGVMFDERTLIRVPSLVDSIKEHGLLVITFGVSEATDKTLGSDAHLVDGVLSMASNDFLDAVVA